jgi:hypothetical protein
MVRTMADRIESARRRRFVGRTAELARLRSLLSSPDPAVAMISGPSGVGKSTLLRRFAATAGDAGAAVTLVDARDIPPTADALAFRVSRVRDTAHTGRPVVIIDTYELLADVDAAFRDEIAPGLPADTLIVLGGQHPASTGWRADPGWSDLLVSIRLPNLADDESAAYLTGRGIPVEAHAAAIEFTHGHPLALALVGEVLQEHGTFAPDRSADVIGVLVTSLVQHTPTVLHRRALEASAQVRFVTEPLLAALIDVPDAAAHFEWLRARPFVESGPSGLYLHDLARTVLSTDLRWRHPELFARMHDSARGYYLARLDSPDPIAQAGALLDLMYLHTDLRPFLQPPDEPTGLRLDRAAGDDRAAVLALIRRHEGAVSAELAARWWEHPSAAWSVVRGASRATPSSGPAASTGGSTGAAAGEVVGAVCLLGIGPGEQPGPDDPAVHAAHRQLRTMPPVRPGERVTLVRFWLTRDADQSVSPGQALITAHLGRHYLGTPGLAISLIPFRHPEEWVDACAYTDQVRMPAADFTVDGRPSTVFGHDWRLAPPAAWIAGLSAREIGAPAAADGTGVPLLVLDEQQFAAAVKRALRDLTRTDRLRDNPLLRSRLITAATGDDAPVGDRVAALQDALRDAVRTLGAGAPADQRLARVLHRAYVAPAPTLERAAEVLDLPSSTFRRLLSTAQSRVVDALWLRELGA